MSAAHARFRQTIEKLWARLDLAAPRLTEPGRIQLRIGPIAIDLVGDDRGSLAVEAVAAILSDDPVMAARQKRMILETNLGLLLGHDTGVYLDTLANRTTALKVLSRFDPAKPLDLLVKKIEDTVAAVEYYSQELGSLRHAQRSPARGADTIEAAVIFRP